MSKKLKNKSSTKTTIPGVAFVTSSGGVDEYVLKSNGLRILYQERPETGVATTNITYLVGARDEERGETGVAHMLEHMLFKPTAIDNKAKIKSGSAMQFERETGCLLNANTWKDRTTYYFSYPIEFFERALKIEAERMNGVVLSDKVLKPEQGNVLSEFDMYFGDPNYALAADVQSTAFFSHPYGHETIGSREDIEDYTAAKLDKFYKNYYRPDNAVIMVVGDIERKKALIAVKKAFGAIKKPVAAIPRYRVREPKQEGLRRVTIERASSTNLVSVNFKSAPFPSTDWFTTSIMLDALGGGPESILHKLLVDTGLASSVSAFIEPTSEVGLSSIIINLAPDQDHSEIETKVLKKISSITNKELTLLIKKTKAKMITEELFSRTSSQKITAELTEYVSSGDWEAYSRTPDMLKEIAIKDVLNVLRKSFNSNNLTIGHFIGKE